MSQTDWGAPVKGSRGNRPTRPQRWQCSNWKLIVFMVLIITKYKGTYFSLFMPVLEIIFFLKTPNLFFPNIITCRSLNKGNEK